MRLLLVGCTGFVGRELVPQLLAAKHQLILVSRKAASGFDQARQTGQLEWLQINPADPNSWLDGPLLTALAQVEGVVNLAGEPIAEQRWTAAHCQKLESSRLDTTRALVKAMSQLKTPPRVLVNASAVGYYGTSPDGYFTEKSPCGQDFLAHLCERWEEAAAAKPSATRLVVVRIGIVLGPDGGALGKMLPVFRLGIGGPVGSGLQWMSWIHRTDLCQLIEKALEERAWSGVVNGVAPEPVPMASFASVLGKTLGRPSLLPVPGPLLKILLGDGARVVLEGQQVVSERLAGLGFRFQYPDLCQALSAATMPTPH